MKKILLFAAAALVASSASAKWVSIVEGGKAADGQSASFQAGWAGPAQVVDNPKGDGKVFECPIAADPTNPWDSQFFIIFNEGLQEGTNYKVSFDYYCTDSRTVDMQAQGEPGAYQHWTIGMPSLEVKPEWQSANSGEVTVSAEMAGGAGFKTIAFNLASAPEAATFYINNIVVEMEVAGEDPVEPGSDWTSLINGGKAADGETASLQAGWSGPAPIVDNPKGDGKVFECPIAADPSNPWDSQFFIIFNEGLQEGEVYQVSFDYYCTDSRTVDMQAQGEPGAYQHWTIGMPSLEVKPEWQSANSGEVTVSAEMAGGAGFKTIAFNLASAPAAATFYINNVVVEKQGGASVSTVNAVVVPAQGVYNLQGVKVADSLDEVAAPGLYIANGKKVIKK